VIATLSAYLYRRASGVAVAMAAALTLLFALVIVPNFQNRLEALSGGVSLLDLRLAYSPEQARAMLAAYGAAGRPLYRSFAATGDIVYPVVYATLFALLVSWLFLRGFGPASRWRRLNVLPFAAMLFDWLENAAIIAMLKAYPDVPDSLIRLGSAFTGLKWAVGGLSILLVALGLVRAAAHRFHLKA
jgi:hypothetical protein